MNQSRIQSILQEDEGFKIELKQCRTAINRDVYETVCAFLNRQGGSRHSYNEKMLTEVR